MGEIQARNLKLRILHILQNYYPSKGGTQLLFQSISERLVKNYSDQVDIATTDSMYDPGSTLYQKLNFNDTVNGVVIHRFSYDRFWRIITKSISKVLIKLKLGKPKFIQDRLLVPRSKSMKDFITNFHADVVCASSSNYLYMNYATDRFNSSNPKPFVFMGAIHFDDEKDTHIPQWVLNNIINSDLYIANTNYEAERLVKLGVPHDTIRVVGCGVDSNQYNQYDKLQCKVELGIPKDVKVIGYIGRFAPNKDIILLLEAFVELDENAFLILAGASNAYLSIVLDYIGKLDNSISDRIKVVVDFDESQKSKLFTATDIFVSPSYSESFGIVFLEAWVSKLPVIGANIGAIASVIDHGKNGLLFEPRNKKSLIENINTYLSNDSLRIIHGEAGMRKTLTHYTWDIIASKYRDIYIEAIEIFNKKCADLQA